MTYTATIGFFDGVHQGHRYVVNNIIADAKSHGLSSMVVTFRQHPRQVLQQDYIPQLLTQPDVKESLLQKTGIDKVLMLDFTPELSQLSALSFMKLLHDVYGVRRLLIGYDNRFGHNREAGFNEYCQYGKEIGIEVADLGDLKINDRQVSSSFVRSLLNQGDIKKANKALGYAYGFSGLVIHGRGEGKKLGFPTANMQVPPTQLVPARGVYAVKVTLGPLEQFEPLEPPYLGMMNIGIRPTYGELSETLEVNIFDFNEDIYDKEISVHFIDRIREEKKFSSIEELKAQLKKDQHTIQSLVKPRNP